MSLRVSAAAWKLRLARSDGDYFGHLYDTVSAAHDLDAEVLVLPELTVLELLSLAPDLEERDVPAFLVQFADSFEEWLLRISASSGLTLVGGSHFRRVKGGIANACAVATPDGRLIVNNKNKLTAYERDVWRLAPGRGLSRLQDERLGVLICYDCEFPEAGRRLVDAGVQTICVPAFTEDVRAFQRVRWAAHSRAVENQVYVVHASLVGELGREPVPSTFGTSAILTPSHEPFPLNAVLDETRVNEEGLAVADVDFEMLTASREDGEVRNWDDRVDDNWTVA
ncbi:MAG: hypothetical protein HY248_02250 [Fimbriimonas ginsengisoli]|nr:hypothetical protein [Fimbriimonas ginsengisoli]